VIPAFLSSFPNVIESFKSEKSKSSNPLIPVKSRSLFTELENSKVSSLSLFPVTAISLKLLNSVVLSKVTVSVPLAKSISLIPSVKLLKSKVPLKV